MGQKVQAMPTQALLPASHLSLPRQFPLGPAQVLGIQPFGLVFPL